MGAHAYEQVFSFPISTSADALFRVTAELSRFCEMDKVEGFCWAAFLIIKRSVTVHTYVSFL